MICRPTFSTYCSCIHSSAASSNIQSNNVCPSHLSIKRPLPLHATSRLVLAGDVIFAPAVINCTLKVVIYLKKMCNRFGFSPYRTVLTGAFFVCYMNLYDFTLASIVFWLTIFANMIGIYVMSGRDVYICMRFSYIEKSLVSHMNNDNPQCQPT